jgi:transcriptional regulator with XRE-family HTH domain
MHRDDLAAFLRARRDVLSPEDVGMTRGPRRRTPGLRREEVAMLAGISTDYLNRIEQSRGARPSEQVLGSLTRALRLSLDQRDHLFALAGYATPDRAGITDHIGRGILRILDRLADTPAQVITELGETLAQTEPAKALLGDASTLTGLSRATVYRWFTDPTSRRIYTSADHDERGRTFVAELRAVHARQPRGSRADRIVSDLLERSTEFAAIWKEHDVSDKHPQTKRFWHPDIGEMTLECQTLLETDTRQRLLVFTAEPGSEDAEKLTLLGVLGTQRMAAGG